MENFKTYHLAPINGRESFGGKCHINEYTLEDGTKYSDLISYNTRVAYYNHSEKYMTVLGHFSATTGTHINTFLSLFGFDAMTKKEMEQKPQIETPKEN
jgi:hypothetical protein